MKVKMALNIIWTPALIILDRHLLDIGDQVIIGYQVILMSHVIKKNAKGLVLYTNKVKIGHNCFIGAGSRIGVGAVIPDNSNLPVCTDVRINEIYHS
jgi:acetyltransferase-like isoleucine patch superfamily enzyme